MLDSEVWSVIVISIPQWCMHITTKNSLSTGPFRFDIYTHVGCNGHPISSSPLSFKV